MIEPGPPMPPPDWPEAGELMTNFDHTVDAAMAARLQTEQVVASYPGWDFYATCWYAEGQYHAAVRRFGQHIDTLSAETAEALMEETSALYGAG